MISIYAFEDATFMYTTLELGPSSWTSSSTGMDMLLRTESCFSVVTISCLAICTRCYLSLVHPVLGYMELARSFVARVDPY